MVRQAADRRARLPSPVVAPRLTAAAPDQHPHQLLPERRMVVVAPVVADQPWLLHLQCRARKVAAVEKVCRATLMPTAIPRVAPQYLRKQT